MSIYFTETHIYNPWWNLAVEKYLSAHIKPGDVILYLWQNDRTVVIGRNQNALRECNVKQLEADGGFLARRTTGGGAVYQDLGNLCFTFLASPECYDLKRQMKTIRNACQAFGIETELSGRNDIVTRDGRKFSGNAFSHTAVCSIQHGTLMVDLDTSQLGRYLTPSKEKLQAKGVRSVRARVCNLRELNPDMTTEKHRAAIKETGKKEYGGYTELSPDSFRMDGGSNAPEILPLFDRFASWDWRYGKSPGCEAVYEKRFSWGEVSIHLSMKNLCIAECKVYSDALDTDLPRLLEHILIGQRYDFPDEEIRLAMQKEAPLEAADKDVIRQVLDWLRREIV